MATKKTTKKKRVPGIKPPFGYGEVLPLKKTHRVVLLDSGVAPEFCRSTNAVAVSISEFNPAARDYPIVFATATPKPNPATALKKAAQITAILGERTRVETTVAIAFAASFIPFRKSNRSARAMMKMTRKSMEGDRRR